MGEVVSSTVNCASFTVTSVIVAANVDLVQYLPTWTSLAPDLLTGAQFVPQQGRISIVFID